MQRTVSLQLDLESDAVLAANMRAFQARFTDATEGDADSSSSSTATVPLAVFGLNDWNEHVAFEHVLARLRRPSQHTTDDRRDEQDATLVSRARVACAGEWTYELSFSPDADDAMWAFTNALVLQLRSAGIHGRVLLATRGSRPVVLASGIAKHSPFASNDDAKTMNWSGAMRWSAITVDDVRSRARVQVVRLPVPAPVALHYPALAPLVDDLVRSSAASRKPAVVVLRGIPGSGKSTLGREIAALCAQRTDASCAIVSADTYFVGPRGYVFDVKRIGKAHDECKRQFDDALMRASGAPRIVVVDNTHTQQWEYAHYVDRARALGSRVAVLEMHCQDLATCVRMAQRNSHGVALDKVVQMHMRFERDAAAQLFAPTFDDAGMQAMNPVACSAVSATVYVGLFLDATARAKVLRTCPPLHTNVLSEHVTLFYRPTKAYVRNVELGDTVTVRLAEAMHDARGQTVRVEFAVPLALKMRNKIPHITVSTAEGVSAYYSNELLEDAQAQRLALAGDDLKVTARVGVAVLVNNQRVTTITSPFEDASRLRCDAQAITRLTLLCLDRASLAAAASRVTGAQLLARLGLREQIQRLLGSRCSTRRVLCLVGGEGSASDDVLLKQLEALLLLSPEHEGLAFDAVVASASGDATDALDDACAQALAAHPISTISVVTTQSPHLHSAWRPSPQLPLERVTVSTHHIELASASCAPSGVLAAPFALSLAGAMDVLHLGVQERTRHAIHVGVRAVRAAWSTVLREQTESSAADDLIVVERIDSSLAGLGAPVIDVCAVASATDVSLAELQHALARALTDAGAEHVVSGHSPGQLFVQLCARHATHATAFCVQIARASDIESPTLQRLAFCQAQRQQTHALLRETETYAALVALVRAALRGRCALVAEDAAAASAIHLLSEKLVLRFLLTSQSTDKCSDDAADAEPDVLQLLRAVLEHLCRLSHDAWAQEFAAVRALVPCDASALDAMPRAVAACAAILQETASRSRKAATPDKRSTDVLELVLALVQPQHDQPDARGVHCTVDILNATSSLDVIAVCDAMRVAAQSIDDAQAPRFFACGPSRIALHCVEVVATSRELLAHVVASVQDAGANSALERLELCVR